MCPYLNQDEYISLFSKFLTKVRLQGGWWSTEPVKKLTHMANTNKKTRQNLSEFDSENQTT